MSNGTPFQVSSLIIKDDFDTWCINMKALLGAYEIWEPIEKCVE